MIWHPLVWIVWTLIATGGVLYGMAALRALDAAANWRPGGADADQLRRERRAEAAFLLGRWSLGCLAIAALIGLVGITRVWHHLVPGAMCGTGVLQAMGSHGGRSLSYWGVSLVILFAWRVVVRLDRSRPGADLTETAARLLLTAAPFLILAIGSTWPALMHVGTARPVSCCAAVYDRVLAPSGAGVLAAEGSSVAVWGSLVGSAVLLGGAACKRIRPDGRAGWLLPVAAAGWAVAATIAVNHVWSAYYYQVLSHPCPWCLFLPDHHGAGFLIFGSLTVAVLESLALGVAATVGRRHPRLAAAARHRVRRAAARIAAAVVAFTLLTAGVAVAWRLKTGVWLDGSL